MFYAYVSAYAYVYVLCFVFMFCVPAYVLCFTRKFYCVYIYNII